VVDHSWSPGSHGNALHSCTELAVHPPNLQPDFELPFRNDRGRLHSMVKPRQARHRPGKTNTTQAPVSRFYQSAAIERFRQECSRQ
jgi:hypothetical protein